MALHSKKSFSILSLFIVALFTVAAGDVHFRPSSSYTVWESEGYIAVKVCPSDPVDEQSANDTLESSGSMPLTVHITSQGQSASKL